MIDRIVELRRVGQLKAHPNNVRTHPNKQIERLAQSLKTFGFTSPVLIDENGFVLAGHARVAAARVAGVPKVPCIVLKGLTEAQKRATLQQTTSSPNMPATTEPRLQLSCTNLYRYWRKLGSAPTSRVLRRGKSMR